MAVVSTQPTKVALFYDLPTMWVYFFAILWFWARHDDRVQPLHRYSVTAVTALQALQALQRYKRYTVTGVTSVTGVTALQPLQALQALQALQPLQGCNFVTKKNGIIYFRLVAKK